MAEKRFILLLTYRGELPSVWGDGFYSTKDRAVKKAIECVNNDPNVHMIVAELITDIKAIIDVDVTDV